ncbi:hypothetical protein L9F63_016952, partial [Diploptera punctata]
KMNIKSGNICGKCMILKLVGMLAWSSDPLGYTDGGGGLKDPTAMDRMRVLRLGRADQKIVMQVKRHCHKIFCHPNVTRIWKKLGESKN